MQSPPKYQWHSLPFFSSSAKPQKKTLNSQCHQQKEQNKRYYIA
jgi:hypothetical protein